VERCRLLSARHLAVLRLGGRVGATGIQRRQGVVHALDASALLRGRVSLLRAGRAPRPKRPPPSQGRAAPRQRRQQPRRPRISVGVADAPIMDVEAKTLMETLPAKDGPVDSDGEQGGMGGTGASASCGPALSSTAIELALFVVASNKCSSSASSLSACNCWNVCAACTYALVPSAVATSMREESRVTPALKAWPRIEMKGRAKIHVTPPCRMSTACVGTDSRYPTASGSWKRPR